MNGSGEVLPTGPYVILGGPPFEFSANQTSLQMFDAIGASRPVVYVCRRYQGSVLRRLVKGPLGKTSTTLKAGLHRLDENRSVLVLPWLADFLPMIHPEASRQVMRLIVMSSLMKTVVKLKWDEPVLITYWWMFPEIVELKMWRFRIFDIIDRHWGYSYEQSAKVRQRNFDLAVRSSRVSNRVVCVSEGLRSELVNYARPELLPNAIDLKRVNRSVDVGSKVRAQTAIYAGGWNERLDVDLLVELVKRHPEWQFSFLGAAADKRFAHFHNVKFFGDVAYDTVLHELSRAQIGLIPFVSNAYTESSNLLKVLDYLSTGVTVGATNLASLHTWGEKYPSQFRVLDSIEDWDNFFGSVASRHASEGGVGDFPDMEPFGTQRRAKSLVSGASQNIAAPTPVRKAGRLKRVKLD